MTADEFSNINRLTTAQRKFVDALLKKNPQPDVEIDSYIKILNGGWAAPVLTDLPQIIEISPKFAKRILRRTKLWPHDRRLDQSKIYEFALLMRSGKWQLDTKQPIMIAASGVLLNGRHRLRALIRAGTPVMMPIIDRYGVTIKGQTIKTE